MTSYEIDGRKVTMPVEVRDASSGTVIFEISADAAAAVLPPPFAPVEVSPGRSHVAIVVVDYRDNDLGAYREVGIVFFVRPQGSDADGTFIARLPVDQPFTCAAGRRIWGFPKTLERIDLDLTPDSMTCELFMDGERVLRLTMPRGGSDDMGEVAMRSYTTLNGRPHVTPFSQQGRGTQLVLGDDGVLLELGSHPVSAELAGLGLPAPAVLSTWNEHMTARFGEPEPLDPA